MALKFSPKPVLSLLSSAYLPFLYETRTLQQHTRITKPCCLFKLSSQWVNQTRKFAHSSASPEIGSDVSELEDKEADPAEVHQTSTSMKITDLNERHDSQSNTVSPDYAPNAEESLSRHRDFLTTKAVTALPQASRPSSDQSKKPLPGTTVTKWESATFEKLYKEFGIPLPPTLQHGSKLKKWRTKKEPGRISLDDPTLDFKSTSLQDELSKVSEIIDEALRNQKKLNEAISSGGGLDDVEAGLNPMSHQSTETSEKISFEELDEPVTVSRIVKLVVQREGEKIENVLHDAISKGVTDIEFWQLCQDHVFSLVRGLEDEKSALDDNSDTGIDLRTVVIAEHISGTASAQSEDVTPALAGYAKVYDDIPEVLPRNAVIPPLYSRLLLLSFHLLRVNFPTSPLLGEFWPTIQSHGRTSILMGASTALYNELIILYAKRLDDLQKVNLVIEEMALTGAEPDMKTGQKIYQILRDRGVLLGNSKDKHVAIGPQNTNRNKKALKRLLREYRSIQKRLAEIQDERKQSESRPSLISEMLLRNE
jgi:hypothetical protein